MKKGAMLRKNYELILFAVIFLSVLISCVFALTQHYVTITSGATSYIVKEDQQFIFNFTVNNSFADNVTRVNVTIDSTFAYKYYSNGTSATLNIQGGNLVSLFTNTTTVLDWYNASSLVLPGTNSSFWFNATPSTPGTYTLTIKTQNSTGSFVNTTTLTVTVLEIHNVMTTAGTLNFGNINEDQTHLFNITLNNTLAVGSGNITNITITFPSTFIFTPRSNNSADSSVVGGKMNVTFTNTSTSVTWVNSTAFGLVTSAANGSVWFNLTALNPGTYNFTVTTVNSQDRGVHEQNFTVTALEVDNVAMTTAGTMNFSNMNEDTATIFNITFNSTVPVTVGNITNITITFPSTFKFTVDSNGAGIYTNDTKKLSIGATFTNKSISVTWVNSTYGLVTNLVNGSVWFNLTAQEPGNYNLTVTTVNNQNTAAYTQNFTVSVKDITDPVPTYSCTKPRVSEGEYLSCSCNATDNYDPSPDLVYTSEPVTTNAGTYIVTCIATDDATYNGTASVTYIVEASGGNVVSGTGGGTTYTNTFAEDTKEFSEIKEVSKELGAKSRIRIKINNIKHEVGVKELTLSTATIETSSTPQTTTMNIGDIKKFDVTNDGYYDLSVTLSKIANSKASITLKSIYEKVTTETTAQEQGKEQAVAEQTQPETATIPETKSNTVIWVIVGIIVILILIGIGYGIKKKKRR